MHARARARAAPLNERSSLVPIECRPCIVQHRDRLGASAGDGRVHARTFAFSLLLCTTDTGHSERAAVALRRWRIGVCVCAPRNWAMSTRANIAHGKLAKWRGRFARGRFEAPMPREGVRITKIFTAM